MIAGDPRLARGVDQARRRDHAEIDHVGAGRRSARRTAPRSASRRSVACRARSARSTPGAPKRCADGATEIEGEIDRDLRADHSPNPVRPEARPHLRRGRRCRGRRGRRLDRDRHRVRRHVAAAPRRRAARRPSARACACPARARMASSVGVRSRRAERRQRAAGPAERDRQLVDGRQAGVAAGAGADDADDERAARHRRHDRRGDRRHRLGRSASARLVPSGSTSGASNVLVLRDTPSMLSGSVATSTTSASTSGRPRSVTVAGSTPMRLECEARRGRAARCPGGSEPSVSSRSPARRSGPRPSRARCRSARSRSAGPGRRPRRGRPARSRRCAEASMLGPAPRRGRRWPTIEAAPRTWTSSSLTHRVVDLEALRHHARIDLDRHGPHLDAVDRDAHGRRAAREDVDAIERARRRRRRAPAARGARSMSYSERSTVAANACSLTVVDRSFEVRYWTSTRPRSPLMTIELSGCVHAVDADRDRVLRELAGEDEPGVQDRGQQDGRQLEVPVAQQDAHRRSASDGGRSAGACVTTRASGSIGCSGSLALLARPASAHRASAAGTGTARRGACGRIRLKMRRRSCSSVRLRSIRPRTTRLIEPVSSLTTTTTASVCSLMPIAARWRVP